MKRVHPDFELKVLNEILDHKKCGTLIQYTTAEPLIKKFLILKLSNNSIGFKVINLGAGVTKITTNTEICPKCGGKGKV